MDDFEEILGTDLAFSLRLTEFEHSLIERGRAVDEEMRALGHRLDPLTFLLTAWQDLCARCGLDDEQSGELTRLFSEQGGLGRALVALQEIVASPSLVLPPPEA